MEVNDLSRGQYFVKVLYSISFKTSMLKSDLCNYSDAYIVVKGTITAEWGNNAKKVNK